MSKIGNPVQAAFTRAVSNDNQGVVSERDARNIVDAAVGQIHSSDKPQEAFESSKRFIRAAEVLLGKDRDAKDVLGSYEDVGLNAVTARIGQLTGQTQLPHSAEASFKELMGDHLWGADNQEVTISSVEGNEREGYSFDYKAGDNQGKAHIYSYGGEWVSSPVPLEKRDLDRAVETVQSHFDEYLAAELRDDWGLPPEEVASIREGFSPRHVYFPWFSSDPYDFSRDFQICFAMTNPTGSDYGFFVGMDLDGPRAEAYDFN